MLKLQKLLTVKNQANEEIKDIVNLFLFGSGDSGKYCLADIILKHTLKTLVSYLKKFLYLKVRTDLLSK